MDFTFFADKKTKIFGSQAAYHIYFWIFIFGVVYLTADCENGFLPILKNLTVITLLMIPVYTHFELYKRLFNKKRLIFYIISLISTVFFSGILYSTIMKELFNTNIDPVGSSVLVFLLILITTSLKLMKENFQQQVSIQEIKSKQLQTELVLLKSQINPHFLFNTLNNLFGLIQKTDETSANGVAQLSHLMRYMIYESSVDKIELQREVQQINRLIELQKLRFSKEDDVTIKFDTSGDLNNILIPPMLLIPFVENAFKHGIVIDEPSYIHIRLQADEQKLLFTIKNSKYSFEEQTEKFESGMGFINVKRRLKLLFPESHKLTIINSEKDFEIKLSITL